MKSPCTDYLPKISTSRRPWALLRRLIPALLFVFTCVAAQVLDGAHPGWGLGALVALTFMVALSPIFSQHLHGRCAAPTRWDALLIICTTARMLLVEDRNVYSAYDFTS